jgi:hypothetical protein
VTTTVWLVAACAAVVAAALTLVILSRGSRRRFARQSGAFRCRARGPWLPGRAGLRARRGARWSRPTQAVWVADVLLVQAGRLRLSVVPIAVHIARNVSLEELDPGRVPGLGLQPLSLRMTDQAHHPIEIAVASVDRARLVGPFLTVSAPGVPGAPLDERGG